MLWQVCGKVEFVQKRHSADSEFILRGDKFLGAVREWTEGLFGRKEFADLYLPEEVKDWFLKVVFCAYGKAENDLVKRMILVKIIHTLEVVRAGMEISTAENEVCWNKNQVAIVCLLHDVGRFDQALLGSYSDEETGFDHALEGAKMVRDSYFGDFERLGIDKNSVFESVKYHSAFSYSGDDIYAKLTRDADKLAILRALPEIMAARIGEFAEGGVSEEALRSYKGKEVVRNQDMKTKTDYLLVCLSWENDFNFAKTKKCFIDEGIKAWMMEDVISVLGVEV